MSARGRAPVTRARGKPRRLVAGQDTLSWFQIWTVSWQIAVVLTPLILAACVLWLRSQFPTKSDFTAERNRVDARHATDKIERDQRYEQLRERATDHETRLRMVETDVARPPSRHQLNNAISTMQGGLHAVEKSVAGLAQQMDSQQADLRRQIETLNGYLHTMIEKHLS